jgi:hypothetical protein
MTPRTPLRRKREPVKVFPDGREVCDLKTVEGKRIYESRLGDMWVRQYGFCRICHKPMFLESTFDHEDGRGMNGSHRDDRIVKDGKPYNGAVHLKCNLEKGSRRGYVD